MRRDGPPGSTGLEHVPARRAQVQCGALRHADAPCGRRLIQTGVGAAFLDAAALAPRVGRGLWSSHSTLAISAQWRRLGHTPERLTARMNPRSCQPSSSLRSGA